MRINPDSTSQSLYFKLVDTTGQPKTGATLTSLAVTYTRDKAAPISNTATALASATAAYSANGMFEVSSGIVPGLYRADFPDAAFASGVLKVQCGIKGAAIDPAYIEVELDYDPVTAIVNNVAAVTVQSGIVDVNVKQFLGSAISETVAGYISAGFKKFFNVATPVHTVASVDQTGDAFASCATLLTRIVGTLLAGNHNAQSGDGFARIGAAGAGLTALGDSRLANLDIAVSTRLATSGYLSPNNSGITDIYDIVNNASYGNAQLVRSTTPANTLTVDSSHRALSDLASILGTALTETAGYLAAGFKKFFNIATPNMTVSGIDQTGNCYPLLDTEITTILGNLTTIITHLTDIKGTGWTTQTLQLIQSTLAALNNISLAGVRTQVDNGISAAALATAANLSTANSNVASILIIAQKLDGMLQLNGALYEFTAQALINSPLVSGGFLSTDRDMITAIKAKTDALPSGIKKNVALSNFPIVMTSDGITPLSGLTVSGFVKQDAGSFAAMTNSIVEVGYGAYRVNLTALEMNADMITLRFTASGAKERQISFLTV
jgi:hypothetical protein